MVAGVLVITERETVYGGCCDWLHVPTPCAAKHIVDVTPVLLKPDGGLEKFRAVLVVVL